MLVGGGGEVMLVVWFWTGFHGPGKLIVMSYAHSTSGNSIDQYNAWLSVVYLGQITTGFEILHQYCTYKSNCEFFLGRNSIKFKSTDPCPYHWVHDPRPRHKHLVPVK